MPLDSDNSRLVAIKLAHTAVWAVFAGCIAAIPVLVWRGDLRAATALCVVVFGEVVVLAGNGWTCPLTKVAARYTDDRRDNFDIFLPLWLARHNKTLFGAWYLVGLAYVVVTWLR